MRLRREDVLAGALGLLDQDGLDGLTMRRLATSLGVGPSAQYWHYRDKQALLEAIAEEIMSGVADVDLALPAHERTAELARRLRLALLTRRDGARVLSGTYVRRPNTLRFGEAAVQALAAAGVPETETALAFFTIQDDVLGHVISHRPCGRDVRRAHPDRASRRGPEAGAPRPQRQDEAGLGKAQLKSAPGPRARPPVRRRRCVGDRAGRGGRGGVAGCRWARLGGVPQPRGRRRAPCAGPCVRG
ncbi:TetR family transcriptional regulator [Kitasatospora sp. NPDC085464]|uniref:TetR family transcriptional regulator n=1 Tax=Kitasatospora sp. NPDC085464 TaxID=3364063 RepID=UPI0037CB1AC5